MYDYLMISSMDAPLAMIAESVLLDIFSPNVNIILGCSISLNLSLTIYRFFVQTQKLQTGRRYYKKFDREKIFAK